MFCATGGPATSKPRRCLARPAHRRRLKKADNEARIKKSSLILMCHIITTTRRETIPNQPQKRAQAQEGRGAAATQRNKQTKKRRTKATTRASRVPKGVYDVVTRAISPWLPFLKSRGLIEAEAQGQRGAWRHNYTTGQSAAKARKLGHKKTKKKKHNAHAERYQTARHQGGKDEEIRSKRWRVSRPRTVRTHIGTRAHGHAKMAQARMKEKRRHKDDHLHHLNRRDRGRGNGRRGEGKRESGRRRHHALEAMGGAVSANESRTRRRAQ